MIELHQWCISSSGFLVCIILDEVYKLRGREGPNIDRRLDQVRHDLNEDIYILNSQLQELRTTGSNRLSDNHYLSLSRDVQEM